MNLSSIKLSMEMLRVVCFLPDDSIGVGFKALCRYLVDGETPELKGSDLAAYNLLMRDVKESIVEHERAVERGKKSAQVRQAQKAQMD